MFSSGLLLCHTGKILARTPQLRTMCAAAPILNVKVSEKTGVAVVNMNNPPVNVLSLELLNAIIETCDDLGKNKSRGMVLTSALETVFSAGLDINEFLKPDKDRFEAFWSAVQTFWWHLYGSHFPTAAAINGHAPAAGCLAAISCEYRVMVEGNFRIGINDVALGFPPPAFVQNTLKSTISVREAEAALNLGKLYSVEEAMKIRLVDEAAVDKREAVSKCKIFIHQFEKMNPFARNLTKNTFRKNIMEELRRTKEECANKMFSVVSNKNVQTDLEMYVENLKSKNKKNI